MIIYWHIIRTEDAFMDISDILPLPDIERCSSLLCIQPHPDDNEVGAGATIAKLAAKGCNVTYLTVTDGSMGSMDESASPKKITEIRRNEARASASYLGVSECIFLDFPDGSYPDEKLLCQSIVSIIRNVKPEIVMAPDPFLPYEAHPDHRKVGMAAAEACLFSPFPGFKTQEQTAPWQVSGIAFHSTAYPNTFIDVDATWHMKKKALAMHESQFSKEMLERLCMYFDFKASQYAAGRQCEKAEAFKVLSCDHLHMNVDTINL
jgi:LmbE family N-acetylglucosaminyl deacetylase